MTWTIWYGPYHMVNIIMFCDSIWTCFQLVIATIRNNNWRKRCDEWRCLHCTKLDKLRFRFFKFRKKYPRFISFVFRIVLPNTKIRVNLASVDMILCCASLWQVNTNNLLDRHLIKSITYSDLHSTGWFQSSIVTLSLFKPFFVNRNWT